MKYDGTFYLILENGRRIYANNGILGINPDLEVTEGFDGDIQLQPAELGDPDKISADEKIEIAAYMIDLWRRWAEE